MGGLAWPQPWSNFLALQLQHFRNMSYVDDLSWSNTVVEALEAESLWVTALMGFQGFTEFNAIWDNTNLHELFII